MSYASVAAQNSEGGGAKPSQEWLEGSLPSSTDGRGNADQVQNNPVDVDTGKINVVPHGSNLDNLRTDSAEQAARAEHEAQEHQRKLDESAAHDANVLREAHDARVQAGNEAEEKKAAAKSTVEQKYQEGKAYAEKEAKSAKAWAEKEGKKLSKDAKRAEKTIAKKAKETSAQIQEGWAHLSSDPKAWGTLLGAVNVALLGGLGYFVYRERNNVRTWDRRLVSAVTVGVLGLLGGQGYVAAETARKQQGKK